ncbi:solute carrier organic anion transporter family member 1A2-like [Rhinophrynus dorsalis]
MSGSAHFEGSQIFICVLSYAYVTKGLAHSYSSSMITQIERRFNIPSSLVGVIGGSFDIGNLLVIASVSYFGAKMHRPRVMAAGCLIIFLGSSLTALPHFLMRRYQYDRAVTNPINSTSPQVQLCLADQSHPVEPDYGEECKSGSESLMWIFVMVGNILQGIGEAPIEPLGLSYVDDFAKVENSPFYIGIIQTVSIAGPFLGSLLAAFCSKLYVDIGFINLDNVSLRLNDIRWVGAWWIGFLGSGAANALAAIFFWFLPKSLPKEGEEDHTELKEALRPIALENNGLNGTKNKKEKFALREFLQLIKDLYRNKIYMLFLIVTVLQFDSFAGYIAFMPKFVEQQYGKSSSEAIFLIGVYNLPVICIGYFLGGLMMKKFKVSTYLAAHIGFWSEMLNYLIYFVTFALVCRNAAVAGLTVSYDGYRSSPNFCFQRVFWLMTIKAGTDQVSSLNNFTFECNLRCDCPADVWDPVCGDNGVAYISACFAGCESSTGSGQDTVFHNCSCVASSGLSSNGSAALGQCPREEKCDTMLLYYLMISLLCCLIFSFGAMPAYMVLIRSLKPEEKALGLGLHLLAARTLGGIPSPIFYGAVVDTTCIKWGTSSCGEPGACRLYDTDAYR